MKEQELSRFVGSMQQVASVRPVTYSEGRATGLKAYEVKNGFLRFMVMADKALDIGECSYKGINISFLSKPGLQGRAHYDTLGEDAQRGIMGGLLFTCGLENICPPCTVDGKSYPMHGRMRTTPAEHVCADAFWQDGQYRIKISGEMREAELFGENMVLRRSIECVYGEKTITIRDEIKNCSYRPEPMMILYHFNAGYPLLQEGARLVLPTRGVTPRDQPCDMKRWHVMDAPKDNAPEQVFMHALASDANGDTFAAIVNDTLELGLKLEFNQKNLPNFVEWKSMGAGDYALGLEPANGSLYGRIQQQTDGFRMLSPFESAHIELKITFVDGRDDIDALDNHALMRQ